MEESNKINDSKEKNEDSNDSNIRWVSWFCSLKENEFLAEVSEEFIDDGFNLYGLNKIVPDFYSALDILLSNKKKNENFVDIMESIQIACDLYGLIHARYITTDEGLQQMYYKYKNKVFGCCPKLECKNHPVLPIGISEDLLISRVKVYCPKCEEVYFPDRWVDLDGAYFGPNFPHIFLEAFPKVKFIKKKTKGFTKIPIPTPKYKTE